jgi:plasmid stabilization system protein ParE
MRILFTPEAEEQAERCDTWWRENRLGSPDLFARELSDAKALLLKAPDIGSVYATIESVVVRRLLMRKTRHHLYYVLELEQNRLTIHAVWGAPRERGPEL